MIKRLLCIVVLLTFAFAGRLNAQINSERVLMMGRSALYYEDYVLSIQRFNMVISAKPQWAEAYFYRGLAKFYLEDYSGAETDCSSAIYYNPYSDNFYVLRGLSRIHLKSYDKAEEDYQKAININPTDAGYWHNMVLCQMEQESYGKADSCLALMISKWPKVSENYTMRGQVKLAEKDTVTAEQWVDRSLEVNAFDGSALSIKAMLLLSRNNYKEGEAMLDRAIIQMPRKADLYINRGIARYSQENLRGAMNDYDAALELNENSFVGHFNRGLLRAQVGDDNHAIEDFNFVIERDPDNHIAIYNRAILLNNVGDYKGAMRDLTTLLDDYPEFWDGYLMRAQIRRKVGDTYGAERDEFKVMKARIEGTSHKKKSTKKTRKVDDHDLEDYNKLIENDSQETVHEYASAYRGRVQDQATALQPMPSFVLSYYEHSSAINRYVPYIAAVEALNNSHTFFTQLHVSNQDVQNTEGSLQRIFDDISSLESKIDTSPNLLLRRAVDYYHVRDFESGIADVDAFLDKSPDHIVALYLRAQLRSSLLMAKHQELAAGISEKQMPTTEMRLSFKQVLDDLKRLTEIDSKLQFAYFNMGNIHVLLHDYDLAVEAYNQAIAIDSFLPDAFYNRGIAYILLGDTERGLSDLSQAGELGLYSAYSLIKQYSKK